MARKALIEKEKRRKQLATRYAAKRKRLKAIVHNRATSPEERFEAALQLQSIPRNAAPVRQRNRCSQTGRPRVTIGVLACRVLPCARWLPMGDCPA